MIGFVVFCHWVGRLFFFKGKPFCAVCAEVEPDAILILNESVFYLVPSTQFSLQI